MSDRLQVSDQTIENFRKNLKAIRLLSGATVEDMADSIGITKPTYHRLESTPMSMTRLYYFAFKQMLSHEQFTVQTEREHVPNINNLNGILHYLKSGKDYCVFIVYNKDADPINLNTDGMASYIELLASRKPQKQKLIDVYIDAFCGAEHDVEIYMANV